MKNNKHWAADVLHAIVKADDLHVAPFRDDGRTYGTPTWIWCVDVDGELHVRAYNGPHSTWYRSAVDVKAGKIEAAGHTYQVAFEPEAGKVNDAIDEAYRKKYKGSPYLAPMISARARSATMRVVPKE